MRNDLQDLLSGMLVDWHHYCDRTGGKNGYPGRAAGFQQCKSSNQYDWLHNTETDDIDKRIMEGFHAATERIPQPWNTALQFEARNLAVRYQVWTSPRLPANVEARHALVMEARVRLLKELAADGVLC